MERIRHLVRSVGQPLVFYGGGLLLVVLLLDYRLGSLPADLSPAEVSTQTSALSWRAIIDNPLYAPYKLLLLAINSFYPHHIHAVRVISAACGLLGICLFFSVARRWVSHRIALLGTALFATSTWFLIAARVATPEILQIGILALMAVGGWLRYSRGRVMPVLIGASVAALACYIPGLIWFVLIALIWQRKTIRQAVSEISLFPLIIAALLFVGLLAPLVFALVRQPSLWRPILGIPDILPTWQNFLKQLAYVPTSFFIRTPLDSGRWLGRLPLLDIFSTAMFGLGLYNLYKERRLDRVRLLAGAGILGSLLIGLGGPVTLTLLLPFVYIIICGGMAFLLEKWLSVFPRNPLARGLGMMLIAAAVATACFYQAYRYFEAWNGAVETKQIYSQKL